MLYQENFQDASNPERINLCSYLYRQSVPAEGGTDPNANADFPPHCHPYYEINYSIDGSAILGLDGREILAPPHSLLFYEPLAVHETFHEMRSDQMVLQFSPRLLSGVLPSFPGEARLEICGGLLEQGYIDLSAYPDIFRPASDLAGLSIRYDQSLDQIDSREFHERAYTLFISSPELEFHMTRALLDLLGAMLKHRFLRISRSGLSISGYSRMQSLISRLVSSPEQMPSMKEAARLSNQSYSNFCRSFKKNIGLSYVDFCNMIRIQRAKELLNHNSMSITDIAASLNFGSISYFNRVFKKHTGASPLTYRANRDVPPDPAG